MNVDRSSMGLQTTDLVQSLQLAPTIQFDGSDLQRTPCDHVNGVNCLAIDDFEGRFLLTGGVDGSINLYDIASSSSESHTYKPVLSSPKPQTHKFGVTHISHYPFDTSLFLSSSCDHCLVVSPLATLVPAFTFDLDAHVYSHAISPIASHLLIACATASPHIRLADLRSGAAVQSLPGHVGDVLGVAWSPCDEYLLASSGADGTVRLWDVRRSSACLKMLDKERVSTSSVSSGLQKAHMGPANALLFAPTGKQLITAGHDRRIRVFDLTNDVNTLVHFGVGVRNAAFRTVHPLIVPCDVLNDGTDILVWPNVCEICFFEVNTGRLIKKLSYAGNGVRRPTSASVMDLAWRGVGDVELYSAHKDGLVRAWKPHDSEEEEEEEEQSDNKRKRKRDILDDVVRELSTGQLTLGL